MAEKNLLHEGISLYNRKNYTGALTFFLSLPADYGCDSLELAYYIGLCYAKLNRYDDALLYLEQVVTGSPDDRESYDRVLQCRYLLAVIYCVSGRHKLADFELNKLLETGYRTSSVYSSLAYIAWEHEEVSKCMEYYNKALSEDENNPTALNGLGYVLASEDKELTRALSLCKKALDLEPDSPACMDSLGWVYYRMGLYSESKKLLEKALKADPSSSVIAEHLKEVQRVEQ